MTILEYLYKRYECSDLDTLEARSPVNINNLNLNNKMYKELEDILNDIGVMVDEKTIDEKIEKASKKKNLD